MSYEVLRKKLYSKTAEETLGPVLHHNSFLWLYLGSTRAYAFIGIGYKSALQLPESMHQLTCAQSSRRSV